MKKIASLLCLIVITAGAIARADMTITVSKASDTRAKVASSDGKGGSSVVPIKFDDGADWSCVKDTYNVSDDTAKALMDGKEYISVGTDGTATFHSTMWMKMKKMMTGHE